MRYQVGGVDDPAGRAGLAHVVEHLMFDRVDHNVPLFRTLEAVSTYFNATTSLDATTFISRGPKAHLEKLLAVEAARLVSPCTSIDASDFAREREVVLNELRERERATDVLDAMQSSLFPAGHPYHRRVIGTPDSISAITRDDACAFADANYTLDNAVLVVSGPVSRPDVQSRVESAFASIKTHRHTPPPAISLPELKSHTLAAAAPIDDPALVLAWPMPRDTKVRAKLHAVLATAAELAAGRLDGIAAPIEIGDSRAPMIGLLLAAGPRDTHDHLINVADQVLRALPHHFERTDIKELDPLAFGSTQQRALLRLYTVLANGRERDPMLAAYLAAGHDPALEIDAELAGIRGFTREEASQLARTLGYSRAIIVSLEPASTKKVGSWTALDPRVDIREPRKLPVDPAEADAPMTTGNTASPPTTRARRLANGLRVVLVDDASVPTFDARLVFAAGTGDDPPGRRGTALMAARTLAWDMQYVKDLLLFATAGGTSRVDVGLDRTTFTVRGTENQLDYLLAGMRRWVVDGRYDDDIDEFVRQVRRAHDRPDERAPWTDAWRAAMYGASHTYVKAGLMRTAEETLGDEDAASFRAQFFTPDNATLVVTGHFDPDNVDRWIDFLFASWTGHAGTRRSDPAHLAATSLAAVSERSQIDVHFALASTAGTRAAQLVAAEMLSEITSDVRQRLGATYDLSARLTEHRLSTTYDVVGAVDASRARAAMQLLRDEVEQLRSGSAEARRTFVAARRRVEARLTAYADDTASIADRIEDDLALGRQPLADYATAKDVRELTLGQMTSVLAELDLSRAAMLMNGPTSEVQAAFEPFGRKPTLIVSDARKDAPGTLELPADSYVHAFRDTAAHRLADPLTKTVSHHHVALSATVGFSLATIERTTSIARITDSCLGPSVGAELGIRGDSSLRLGLRAGVTQLAGTDQLTENPDVTFTFYDLGPFVQLQLSEQFWVGAIAAVHYEHDVTSHTGASLGAELGLDVIRAGRNWFGLFGRYELVSATDYGFVTFGAAYRR